MLALWPLGSGELPVSLGGWPEFRPWQLLTYGFLHGSLTHLFFNMFALYMFGGEIERLLALHPKGFDLSLDRIRRLMARLGNHVCSRGEVVPVDQQLAKLRAVTRDQVVSVARRVLAHPPTICGVGPLTDADLGA